MLKKYKFDKTAILNDLEQLPQKEKTDFTVSEIVRASRTKITSALKKGYSFEEIANWFNKHGCAIQGKEIEDSLAKLRTTKIAKKK